MPIEKCPKCHRLHYIPGECPEPRVPLATHVTSPKGVKAVVQGDKPISPKGIEALGQLVDAAVAKMEKKGRGRPKTGFDKKAYDRELAASKRRAKKAARETK